MRGHVDAESLALDAEGLLSRRQSARIRSHLGGCPECTATRQQLTEVTALLGQVPAAPLPPAIAARLDLALTAETARRATGPAAAGATWAANGGPAAAPPADAPPADAPPAAAPPATPAGTHRSPAPPGRARRPAHGRDGTGTRRWGLRSPVTLRLVSVAGAAVVLAAGGYGLAQLSAGSSGSTSTASGAAAPVTALPVYSSGLSYQPTTLGRQAATALARYHRNQAQVTPAAGGIQAGPAQGSSPASGAAGGGHAVTGPASRPGTDSLAPLVPPAEEGILRGCAAAVADGRAVELVDRARYAGRAAIIIVLAAGGGQPATVWVTGPGCSAGHPDKITEGPLGS